LLVNLYDKTITHYPHRLDGRYNQHRPATLSLLHILEQ